MELYQPQFVPLLDVRLRLLPLRGRLELTRHPANAATYPLAAFVQKSERYIYFTGSDTIYSPSQHCRVVSFHEALFFGTRPDLGSGSAWNSFRWRHLRLQAFSKVVKEERCI